MTIERFPITDREQWLSLRKPDVTASVAACLFGDVHPYMTAYKLWAVKSGKIDDSGPETKPMRRGRLNELIGPEIIREVRPQWTVNPNKEYFREVETRIGATPDFFGARSDIAGLGVIQFKSVSAFSFKNWKVDGVTEPPPWIGLQVNIEAALAGATWAAIAVESVSEFGGQEIDVVDVAIKPALMTKLRVLVKDFWRRVEENDPYPVDFGRDSAAVLGVYADADEGETKDLTDPSIVSMVDARERLKAFEAEGTLAAKERREIDARIIFELGNAASGRLADGRIITAKTVRRAGYTAEPSTYRAVRVTK